MADKITARATFRAQRNLINEMVDYKADLDDTIANGGRLIIAQAPDNPPLTRALQPQKGTGTDTGTYLIVKVYIGDLGDQIVKVPAADWISTTRINEIEVYNDADQIIVPETGQILYLQLDNDPEAKVPGVKYITPEGPSANILTLSGYPELIRSTADGLYHVYKFVWNSTKWVLQPIGGMAAPNNYIHRVKSFEFVLSAGGGVRTISWIDTGYDKTYVTVSTTDGMAYTILDITGTTTDGQRIALHIQSPNITLQHTSDGFWQSGGADILTKTGDVLEYIFDDSVSIWKCIGMSRSVSGGNPKALYTGFAGPISMSSNNAWVYPDSVGGSVVYIDPPIIKASTFGFILPVGYYAKMWINGTISMVQADHVIRLSNNGGSPFFEANVSQSKYVYSSAPFSIESPPFLVTSDNEIRWGFKEFDETGNVFVTHLACEVLGYDG